jgi:hypothetical protein
MTTTTKPQIASSTLAEAAAKAGVAVLAGDITTDGRCLCLMFRASAAHDAFFRALEGIDGAVAGALKLGGFPGQATGKLTILKPEFAAFAERRCVLIYCPSVELKPHEGATTIMLDDRGGLYYGPVGAMGWLGDPPAPTEQKPEAPTELDVRALQALLAEGDPGVPAAAQQALDRMHERVERIIQGKADEGCHNVYGDLWQAAGIEFTAEPNEHGVHVLPGLHDDRAAFLAEHPALKVAYNALEAVAAELMDANDLTIDDLPGGEASLLEALFANIGEPDEFGLIDLSQSVDCAKAMIA